MRALAALSRFVGNTFAYWVLIFAVLAFLEPAWFVGLKGYIVPLLGVVMFGMGLTLKLDDFAEVARHPWRVALGVVAHFVIMPGVAWLLCQVFHLPPEIAVGVILVGCCPSGTSSNVMTWLARGASNKQIARTLGDAAAVWAARPEGGTPQLALRCRTGHALAIVAE